MEMLNEEKLESFFWEEGSIVNKSDDNECEELITPAALGLELIDSGANTQIPMLLIGSGGMDNSR